MVDRSLVNYFGAGDGHSCGYCKNADSNFSYGMWAYHLTPEDYQNLIDRGWRRSGVYLYKPQLELQCCPMYTLRCRAGDFKPSTSQKKIIKTFNRFINYGIVPKKYEREDGKVVSKEEDRGDEVASGRISADKKDELDGDAVVSSRDTHGEGERADLMTNDAEGEASAKQQPKAGDGADVSKAPAQKAKVVRMMKKKMKMEMKMEGDLKEGEEKKKKNTEKSLEDFLEDLVENPVHKFEIQTISSQRLLEEHRRNNTHSNTNTTNNTNNTNNTTNNHFMNSFHLFDTYQSSIHHDTDNTIDSYVDFLVASPLITKSSATTPKGSFHQQYFIDDKLVCVGVVDVLSHGVSSVYLFYHPQYAFLSLGTYTALRELAYTRQLQRHDALLQHYYMGFYIHSCPKMKYKAQYHPSYLLCPESFTWQPIGPSQQLIDSNKYSRLANIDQIDTGVLGICVDEVGIAHQGTMTYGEYKRRRSGGKRGKEVEDRLVLEYACLVGARCASTMLLLKK